MHIRIIILLMEWFCNIMSAEDFVIVPVWIEKSHNSNNLLTVGNMEAKMCLILDICWIKCHTSKTCVKNSNIQPKETNMLTHFTYFSLQKFIFIIFPPVDWVYWKLLNDPSNTMIEIPAINGKQTIKKWCAISCARMIIIIIYEDQCLHYQ